MVLEKGWVQENHPRKKLGGGERRSEIKVFTSRKMVARAGHKRGGFKAGQNGRRSNNWRELFRQSKILDEKNAA